MFLLLISLVGLSHGGFLEDDLPLTIMSVTPKAFSGPTFLRERDAITVVFSRAVIALGSDYGSSATPFSIVGATVPGKFRWVTTYIARFDPDVDWPSDLSLSLEFTGLETYNGVALTPPEAPVTFLTNPLTMNLGEVTSEMAMELTDGMWMSSHSGGQEMPPDGIASLRFSSPVDRSMLESTLRITGPSATSITIVDCPTSMYYGALCFSTGALTPGASYTVSLPAGSRYHPLAGPAPRELSTVITGLAPFAFEFSLYRPSYRRYNLWLRHGLASSTTAASLQPFFSLSPSLPITLTRTAKGVLRLSAAFQPDTTYTLTVAASSAVTDGFGLPLSASSATFTTASATEYFEGPNSYQYVLFEEAPEDYAIISRGSNFVNGAGTTRKHSLYPVTPTSLQSYLPAIMMRSFITASPTSSLASPQLPDPSVVSTPFAPLMPNNLLVVQDVLSNYGSYPNSRISVFGVSSVCATFFVVNDADNTKVIAWVTSLSDTSPVAGAHIALYSSYSYGQELSLDTSGTSDASGMLELTLRGRNPQHLGGFVDHEGSLTAHPQLNSPYYSPPGGWKAHIFVERGVYKPGDTVYFKGYARAVRGLAAVVSASSASVSVTWKSEEVRTEVSVDGTYGSFEGTFTVPSDVSFGFKSLTVGVGGDAHAASASFVVSDPRPPTVQLEVEAPQLFNIRPEVTDQTVEITTSTYTGSTVGNAEVSVRWEVTKPSSSSPYYYYYYDDMMMGGYGGGYAGYYYGSSCTAGEEPTAKAGLADLRLEDGDTATSGESVGVLDITSDVSGAASLDLVATLLPAAVRTGDRVEVELEWTGPTREVVKETIQLEVARSPVELEVMLTSARPLPGEAFGVRTSVRDVVSGAQMEGRPASLRLYRVGESIEATVDSSGEVMMSEVLEHECTATTDNFASVACVFTMNAVDKYVVLASIVDDEGYTVTTAVAVGRTQAEFEAEPLCGIGGVSVLLDQTEYSVGDPAVVSFYSPFGGKAMVVYNNQRSSGHIEADVAPGQNSINVVVPSFCSGGCHATVAIAVPRKAPAPGSTGTHTLTLPVEGGSVTVATSALFDANMPRSLTHTTYLAVRDGATKLDVSLSLPTEPVAPGTTVPITVSVTDAGNPVAAAEVCLFAVNKAYLDLFPVGLPDPSTVAQITVTGSPPSVSSTTQFLAAKGGYEETSGTFVRRALQDPWVSPNWDVQARKGADVDLTDEQYFASKITPATTFPYSTYYGGGDDWASDGGSSGGMTGTSSGSSTGTGMPEGAATGMAGGPPMEEDFASDATDAESRDTSGPPPAGAAGAALPRGTFVVTPLFKGAVSVVNGEAVVDMELPDDLSTFVVRAVVVSSDSRFGAVEGEVISRLPLSLQPSQPRIVRDGDTFMAGVTITMADETFDGDVTVRLRLSGEAALGEGEVLVKTVAVTGVAPAEASFELVASEGLGSLAAEVEAECPGCGADSLMSPSIPVLGKQDPVFVATSMAIMGSSGGVWEEGIDLPSAIPGSGTLDIEAGVGRLPSVRGFLGSLVNMKREETRPRGTETVAVFVANTVEAAYGAGSAGVAGSFMSAAAADLRALTTNGEGLRWSSNYYYNRYVDTSLQVFGLLIDQRGGNIDSDLTSLWSQALISGIRESARDAINYGSVYRDYSTLAFASLVLPKNWADGYWNSEVVMYTSHAYLESHVMEASLDAQIAYALGCLNRGEPAAAHVEEIITVVESTLRVQGRTAYVARYQGSQHAADVYTNALALMLLTAKGSVHPLVSKLASWVAEGQKSRQWCYWAPTKGTAVSVIALTEYDVSRGSDKPDLSFSVSSYVLELMRVSFNADNAGSIHRSSSPWEALHRPPAPLSFTAVGAGEVSVALGMSFVPEEISPVAVYRGIFVEKIVQALDPVSKQGTGSALGAVALGESYLITIQVTTPDDLGAACVVDGLPGGLEALDPNLEQDLDTPRGYGYSSSRPWYWYWSPFVREVRPDRVSFCSRSLYAGTYTVMYEAVAASLGTFAFPPTRAYAIEQPELMGLSAGGSLRVVRPGETLTEWPAPADPQSCDPLNCNERGVCDTSTGQCACDRGYGGAGCAEEIAPGTLPPGESCTGNDQCMTGACVDAFCCDTPCLGSCESCSLAGREGTCVNTEACCDYGVVLHADSCAEMMCSDGGVTNCRPYGCDPSGAPTCAVSCHNDTSPCLFAHSYCDAGDNLCHNFASVVTNFNTEVEDEEAGIPGAAEAVSAGFVIAVIAAVLVVIGGSAVIFMALREKAKGKTDYKRADKALEEQHEDDGLDSDSADLTDDTEEEVNDLDA